MPLRIIGYDGASYRSQLLKNNEKTKSIGKSKSRYPVVSLVLYYGEKKWNYSNELLDCFSSELKHNEVGNKISKYISNYQINIFDVGALKNTEIERFKSGFKLVAEYFANVRMGNVNYIPSAKAIVHVDEFLKLMSVLTGDIRYKEYINLYTEEEKKGGLVNMCRILDARESKGRKEGEQRLLNLIDKLLEDDRGAEIANISTNAILRNELYVEYGL